jgi:hypothetical protein
MHCLSKQEVALLVSGSVLAWQPSCRPGSQRASWRPVSRWLACLPRLRTSDSKLMLIAAAHGSPSPCRRDHGRPPCWWAWWVRMLHRVNWNHTAVRDCYCELS